MQEDRQMQQKMHMDFFEKTELAIDNTFYLEAIFREYAAIEGRLEIILGLFGAPCNKNLSSNIRKEIAISHRIKCIKKIYNDNEELGNTKIDIAFLDELNEWIKNRNTITHGFYKNVIKYNERSKKNRDLAKQGLSLAKKLYNEAKRLRRFRDNHIDNNLLKMSKCCVTGCKAKNNPI